MFVALEINKKEVINRLQREKTQVMPMSIIKDVFKDSKSENLF